MKENASVNCPLRIEFMNNVNACSSPDAVSRLHPAAKKTVQHKESSIREERIKQKNLFVFVPKVSFIPVYTSIFIPRYSYPDLILLFSNLSSYNHAL